MKQHAGVFTESDNSEVSCVDDMEQVEESQQVIE
jgi:hypothetical protein